eukprot:7537159-Alexandrium_andersonii.AAC.1
MTGGPAPAGSNTTPGWGNVGGSALGGGSTGSSGVRRVPPTPPAPPEAPQTRVIATMAGDGRSGGPQTHGVEVM